MFTFSLLPFLLIGRKQSKRGFSKEFLYYYVFIVGLKAWMERRGNI